MNRWRNMCDMVPEKLLGLDRSSEWSKVRDKFVKGKPCELCNGRRSLVCHHIMPFHIAPELELVESNLIVLCEAKRYGVNCHLLFGHLGNWRRYNANLFADIAYWRVKLRKDKRDLINHLEPKW